MKQFNVQMDLQQKPYFKAILTFKTEFVKVILVKPDNFGSLSWISLS